MKENVTEVKENNVLFRIFEKNWDRLKRERYGQTFGRQESTSPLAAKILSVGEKINNYKEIGYNEPGALEKIIEIVWYQQWKKFEDGEGNVCLIGKNNVCSIFTDPVPAVLGFKNTIPNCLQTAAVYAAIFTCLGYPSKEIVYSKGTIPHSGILLKDSRLVITRSINGRTRLTRYNVLEKFQE